MNRLNSRISEAIQEIVAKEDDRCFQFMYYHYECSTDFNDFLIINQQTENPLKGLRIIICQTCLGYNEYSYLVIESEMTFTVKGLSYND